MSRGRTDRTLGILLALCLCASFARAEEKPTLFPILSCSDGSRAWLEITSTGNRAKAVPYLVVPEETVRRLEIVEETKTRLLAPSADGKGGSLPQGSDGGKLLKRYKSLAIREGPDGVSLGNAFDLLGDIREATRIEGGSREKMEAVASALRRAAAKADTTTGTSAPGIRPTINLAGEPGICPTGGVRSRIEIP